MPSSELVPGDVLLLAAGDKIAADARIIEAAGLVALEGALTGESTGVSKCLEMVADEAPLADLKNMVFSGTAIARDLGIAGEGSTAMEGADLAKMNDGDFDSALADVAVLGRVAPEHKLRIVARFQSRGEVVVMTGAGEILALFTALLAGLPLPLRAVQILWINLVTDGALTVNLVMEKSEGDEMKRRPLRRNAAMVPRAMLRRMLLLVPVMGFGTVAMFAWALQSGRSETHAQTMTITLLCAFQWFNGLNARS